MSPAPHSPTISPRTISDWLAQHAAPPALAAVIEAVAETGRELSARLRGARLNDVVGALAQQNVQGEQQQKLDVLADALLLERLRASGAVALYASEEQARATPLAADGAYALLADPLDGSSNIDVAAPVGTIFSVLPATASVAATARDAATRDAATTARDATTAHADATTARAASDAPATRDATTRDVAADADAAHACEAVALQPGRAQCAAGYLLYGSSTLLVLAVARGVALFVLDPARDAFALAEDALALPARTRQYSLNEAYRDEFEPGVARFLDYAHGAGYSARYVGSLVADVHRTLLKGGVFLYPATGSAPSGKLRLLYEANPMAYIVERAGGRASTGRARILDLAPAALHERTPLVLGSAREVERVEHWLAGREDAGD